MQRYLVGLDVGSTTVKTVVAEQSTMKTVYSSYERHGARQIDLVRSVFSKIKEQFPNGEFSAAVCGSGGKGVAEALGACFVQEVVAGSLAVRKLFPKTRAAVELGGQDAKIIFFHHDEITDQLVASDMRMNGSCAGGTGAFIDEVASILNIPVEEFNGYASRGTHVHEISGRCGVFAKTDIQPLLNQGVSKEDIALSTFHAISRQTIGGLAQGLEIHPPILFLGGPLTFNPRLISVFAERLSLTPEQIITPEHPELVVAYGTALSLTSLFSFEDGKVDLNSIQNSLTDLESKQLEESVSVSAAFFDSDEERAEFESRHAKDESLVRTEITESELDIYIGIDGGSTTSKCAAVDSENCVLGTWYTHNRGKPIDVIVSLLKEMHKSFADRGIRPIIRGVGTTGYAELLFAKALKADYHTVETVAHSFAALHYFPKASFVLDIGGQDMKAIMINGEVVTGIVLNEACSAGCGSFLENFAGNLNIPISEAAQRSFDSQSPAELGSRCTVFMNSSIITAQRMGKNPGDIMAGLCRSIIENVFTKVVRVSNFDQLGDTIVVQGGTFKNDAVLRAMEQFIGKPVIRAPFPGEMGAIGAALLTKERQLEKSAEPVSQFIGFEQLESFSYTQKSNLICRLCSNSCARTAVTFPDGSTFVTGNRCERGDEIIDDNAPKPVHSGSKKAKVPNLMKERERLLFKPYTGTPIQPEKRITIGIPRTLEFWESLPFWQTFFRTLGFGIVISDKSSPKLYQTGLQNVPSDTVCFPAKLAHGHVQNLIAKGVDRIFMPMMARLPKENPAMTTNHVCAIVKGYPLVINISDDPSRKNGIPFDNPLFHWGEQRDRNRQLCEYIEQTFGISRNVVMQAIELGDLAQNEFRSELERRGAEILADLESSNRFGVVLAGRPYHTDSYINHDLANLFEKQGIPILTLDSLPGLNSIDLTAVRSELTNNFHTRMLSGAVIAAQNPNLELTQIVSFGCGHDAVISDEIISIMRSISKKEPLVLKLDESDVKGPLSIRVRSFVETINLRRASGISGEIRPLEDAYAVKFGKKDADRTILIPNVSRPFSVMAAAAMESGSRFKVEAMPMADRAAIQLGKKYVHNDMCYPAQVNVGELLAALKSGKYDLDKVAVGLAKEQCDCRLAHYAALARKAMDDLGFEKVPIITTDADTKDMHPDFKISIKSQINLIWGVVMTDIFEAVRRRIKPYELVKGMTDEVFEQSLERIASGMKRSLKTARREFAAALDAFAMIPFDKAARFPKAFIIGEFLLNFHEESNSRIEEYLVKNNIEVILPDTIIPMQKTYKRIDSEINKFRMSYPFSVKIGNTISLKLVDYVRDTLHALAEKKLPFYHRPASIHELAEYSDDIMHHSFSPGEGWLIAAEILHHAEQGVNSFIIVQPFGCMPNHVIGRGVMKAIKERHPRIQILPLDFDPDTSFANVENRLQMLIINARELDGSPN